jgi:Type I phosphodiesterase / nucleotide pyrophosphatase
VTQASRTGLSLAQVGTSAAAAVGVPGFTDELGVGECRRVVVCLVDGLGWRALQQHQDLAPQLCALSGGPIDAVFPTTTPVGLGSLGTGLMPGSHGLVGASFLYPETGELLSPLNWGSEPVPVAVQPEVTVFERVARSGVAMATVSPAAYEGSGLTRAVLRGAAYHPAEDLRQRVDAVAEIMAGSRRSFTYVYWAELDRVGHEFGVDSDRWRAALGRADRLVAGLVDALVPGATLVVTADHGMVDCPEDVRIHVDDDRRLMTGVRRIAGEPRARHLYVDPGAAIDVQQAWSDVVGDRAIVLTRQQLVADGYFGLVDPVLAERIGDVMAIPTGGTMFASRSDATVSRLLGQHGALTPDELLVPALVHRVG